MATTPQTGWTICALEQILDHVLATTIESRKAIGQEAALGWERHEFHDTCAGGTVRPMQS